MARSISLFVAIVALTGWTLIDHQTAAQDQSTQIEAVPQAPSALLAQAEPKPKPKTTRKAPAGRVPNGWGKIGLSTEQKKKIYAIQAEYKDQIAELEQQIEALKMKQLEEMEGVLTAEQLGKLKEQKKSKTDSENENSDAKPAQSANSK